MPCQLDGRLSAGVHRNALRHVFAAAPYHHTNTGCLPLITATVRIYTDTSSARWHWRYERRRRRRDGTPVGPRVCPAVFFPKRCCFGSYSSTTNGSPQVLVPTKNETNLGVQHDAARQTNHGASQNLHVPEWPLAALEPPERLFALRGGAPWQPVAAGARTCARPRARRPRASARTEMRMNRLWLCVGPGRMCVTVSEPGLSCLCMYVLRTFIYDFSDQVSRLLRKTLGTRTHATSHADGFMYPVGVRSSRSLMTA